MLSIGSTQKEGCHIPFDKNNGLIAVEKREKYYQICGRQTEVRRPVNKYSIFADVRSLTSSYGTYIEVFECVSGRLFGEGKCRECVKLFREGRLCCCRPVTYAGCKSFI